jgi:predicted permease
MSVYTRLARTCRNLIRGRRLDDDLSQELSSYVDELTERRVRNGQNSAAARRDALLEVGGTEHVKELVREQRFGFEVDLWLRDVRHAVRSLRRSPAFSAVAVGSLALGIGGLTAAFSVVDPLLLRQLPVNRPGDLVAFRAVRGDLRTFNPGLPEMFATQMKGAEGLAMAEFEALRAGHPAFSSLFAYGGVSRVLHLSIGSQIPEELGDEVQVEQASGSFFNTLGIAPAIGRFFDARDEAPGALAVAVIGDRLWHRRFGRDASVIGTTIALTDSRRRATITVTIVGVAPAGFHGLEAGTVTDVWRPFGLPSQTLTPRSPNWWQGPRAVARLRPRLSLQQARVGISDLYSQMLAGWAAEFGAGWSQDQREWFANQRLTLEPLSRGFSSLWSRFGERLLILLVAAAAVFAIASANLAALLVARHVSRYREMAIRLALGSGRYRLVRQLVIESALLAATGGVVGLVIAYWAGRLLVGWDAIFAAARPQASLDARALLFAASTMIVSAAFFALTLAMRIARTDGSDLLIPAQGVASGNRTPSRLTGILIATQVALSMILLVGAGLFLRTMHNLGRVNTGFDQDNIVLFSLNQRVDIEQMLARLGQLPGVESATVWEYGLLRGGVSTIGPIHVDGLAPQPGDPVWSVSSAVGPRFLTTLGISLVAGRDFEPGDSLPGSRRVAIISSTMSRHFFGSEDAVGRFFRPGPRSAESEIVGVAEDTTYRSLRDEPQRTIYLPLMTTSSNSTFALRTERPPAALGDEIRSIAQDLLPRARVSNIVRMRTVASGTLGQERLIAQFSSGLGVLALGLACIGLYGTIAYSVARRTGEIGIRMALGARFSQVRVLFMREMARPVLVGGIIGLAAALSTTRFIEGLLFGVAPADPLTVGAAAALLATVAAFAALLSARKASRVDPLVALRHE